MTTDSSIPADFSWKKKIEIGTDTETQVWLEILPKLSVIFLLFVPVRPKEGQLAELTNSSRVYHYHLYRQYMRSAAGTAIDWSSIRRDCYLHAFNSLRRLWAQRKQHNEREVVHIRQWDQTVAVARFSEVHGGHYGARAAGKI